MRVLTAVLTDARSVRLYVAGVLVGTIERRSEQE
jgi:hypothetical protein